jgi:hypothetical protein
MKRAVLIVAVAALCVAGSAVAQDRSGGLIGSGTRAEDSGQMMGSGNVAGQIMGSGGFTMTTHDQYLGNGGRSEDGRQILGSGMRSEDSGQILGSGNAASQMLGSGGFTMTTHDVFMGSGGRTEDDGQILGSGGLIGSGTRAEDSGQVIGSGAGETSQDGGYLTGGSRGGYLGSGLSVVELPLLDGSSLLVVSSDAGMFVIPIEE